MHSIHEGFHGRDLMIVVGFSGSLAVLKVVLPNVSPVSVAGIFSGQHSVLWCSLPTTTNPEQPGVSSALSR